MPFYCLDGSFCFVGSLLEGWDELPFNVVVGEVGFELVRAFVIEHLELCVMAVGSEEEVGVRVGGL